MFTANFKILTPNLNPTMKINITFNFFSKINSLKNYTYIALIGCSLTATAQSELDANHPLSKVQGTEDVSKRDLFSRHFLTQEGSTAVIGTSYINYEKEGSFHEIKTEITNGVSADYPFANTENVMESHFGATSSSGIKSTTKEGSVIEFLNGKQYWESNGQMINVINANNVPVTVNKNVASYNNIFNGVNAEITILTGKRRMFYVISSAATLTNAPANAEFMVFTEDIQIPASWSHTCTENGISVMDSKNNPVYLYDNPFSVDGGKNRMRNANTIMTATRNGNILSIATKVKTSWLLSADRIFPIMVDPTVTVYPTAVTLNTGTVFTSDGFKFDGRIAFGRFEDTAAGGEDFIRGWAKFDTTSIPDNATINAGTTLFFNVTDGSLDYDPANGHSLAITQIPPSVNPVTATGAVLITTIMQTGYSPLMTSPINTLGWKNHVITSGQIAQDIKNQLPSNNISLGFMPNGDFYPEEYIEAAGWSEAEKPYLIINYTEAMSVSTTTKNIGLYPNPVQSELFIAADLNIQSINVFSMLGQNVANQTAQNSISVAHLSNGIYSIQITLENGDTVNQKFIKN